VLSALLSFLHVLALAVGLPAIHLRARFLRQPLDADGLRRVFAADSWWGIAALLWLATGPWRAFGGLEKGTVFYLGTWLFHLKLGLFLLVVLLELWPMVSLLRWRAALARGRTPDTSAARGLARLSHLELALVVVIALVASFMARGFGQRAG
jgi:putative membrane protein